MGQRTGTFRTDPEGERGGGTGWRALGSAAGDDWGGRHAVLTSVSVRSIYPNKSRSQLVRFSGWLWLKGPRGRSSAAGSLGREGRGSALAAGSPCYARLGWVRSPVAGTDAARGRSPALSATTIQVPSQPTLGWAGSCRETEARITPSPPLPTARRGPFSFRRIRRIVRIGLGRSRPALLADFSEIRSRAASRGQPGKAPAPRSAGIRIV